jgi:hypothetical protein
LSVPPLPRRDRRPELHPPMPFMVVSFLRYIGRLPPGSFFRLLPQASVPYAIVAFRALLQSLLVLSGLLVPHILCVVPLRLWPLRHVTPARRDNFLQAAAMPRVGFEPTIPAFEQAKTVHALDRAAM